MRKHKNTQDNNIISLISKLNDELKKMLDKYLIETIIFLDDKKRGEIKSVYVLDKENKAYTKQMCKYMK